MCTKQRRPLTLVGMRPLIFLICTWIVSLVSKPSNPNNERARSLLLFVYQTLKQYVAFDREPENPEKQKREFLGYFGNSLDSFV